MDCMIFKPAARYPADPRAVFILALSVFSGLTALALDAAPDSLNSVLPRWGVVLWGALLAIGSAVTLWGMARQTISGILTEQIGSVMVAVTTIYYAVIAIYLVGPSVIQTVGIVLAWGLACGARWFQLRALIKDGVKRAAKIRFLESLEDEIRERQARQHETRHRYGFHR